jgi:hypothetical protein
MKAGRTGLAALLPAWMKLGPGASEVWLAVRDDLTQLLIRAA